MAGGKRPPGLGEGNPKTDFLRLTLKPGKHRVKASFVLEGAKPSQTATRSRSRSMR